MKKRNKVISLLCALLIVLTLPLMLFVARAANDTIYFSSVDETVMELNDATMPFFANGVLYVPYTMFDPVSSGSSLGVFSSYSRSKGVVLIYGWDGSLMFDLQKGTATFGNKSLSTAAIVRNSVAFVPLNTVCQCFDLDWSWLMVSHGYVIRVKSSSSVLSDRDFASAAAYTLSERYNTYMQNKAPAPSVSPSPSSPPSVSPKPTTPVNPDPTPSTSPLEGARLHLAFRSTGEGAGFESLLSHLSDTDTFALFLFHPDELTERDDEIRSLLATGHKIGLLLDAETSEAQLRQLERGRQLLSRIAHVPVTMAHSIGLPEEDAATLRDSVFLWKSTVAADEDDLSSAQLTTLITRAVTDAGPHFLLLDDSPTSAAALKNILISLGAKGCAFPPATEVSLSTLN